jgi:LmbE family N-acetylglucosaminyl deacetylase
VTVARPLTVAGVFAHPDDETWSLAGSFALLVPKGVRGAVWTATRGQAGEIAEGSGATRETLPEVREAEERAALAVVGVERVEFGEFVDGQVEGADRDSLTTAVHGFLEREQPDVVVTMEPGGVTAHPDHMAVSAAAQAAFAAYAGGGRDRDKMVDHVLGAEAGYARKLGIKQPQPAIDDRAAIAALREALLEVLRAPSDGSPPVPKGWPPRYAARRLAWHVLDHAWEMQDRTEPAEHTP